MPALFESGCFFQDPAWHRSGHVLQAPIPAEEMFRLAEADFGVHTTSVFWFDESAFPRKIKIDGYKALIRSDKQEVLSIVSEDYRVLQNSRTLLPLAQALREDTQLSAVCVLDRGRRVTTSAKILTATRDVADGDPIDAYISAVNSFDMKMAFTVTISPVRIVCNNTLQAAIASGDRNANIVRIPHVGNAEELVKQVPSIIDFGARRLTATIEELQAMAKVTCGTNLFREYLERVWAADLKVPINDVRGDDSTQRERRLEDLPCFRDVTSNYLEGKGIGMDMPHASGTLYGAYNSITQFLSHQYLEGGKDSEPRRRFSLQFGKNARILQRAHEQALELTRA